MSYKLNKTDGSLLTDLIDGQIDSQSTDLVLVGRNYTGFGEFINENFIKMLENFANTAAPARPLEGQLWWDTTELRVKVWDGTQWKASGGPFVQKTRPQMNAGDQWIDTVNQQMYFYDGNSENQLTLLGPGYNKFQGTTGFEIESILDVQSRPRPIAKLFIAGEFVGAFSNLTFTPRPAEITTKGLTGLVTEDNPTGVVKEGFNPVDINNFKWQGVALSSEALVNDAGEIVRASQFLPSDAPGETSGTLTVTNNGGITLGSDSNNVQKVLSPTLFVNENQLTDQDYSIRVRSSAFGTIATDAIYIKADTAHVGIFKEDPAYTLDVAGNVNIDGNLFVQGDTTQVNVTNLEIEDKTIELAKSNDSTIGDDEAIDLGGIILTSSDSPKTMLWSRTTNSWTSNVNFDLDNGRVYKINGVTKLSDARLENTILFAEGLRRIGTLEYLDVDNININSSAITASQPLTINSTDTITINNRKITGVIDPTVEKDVANKNYVDTQIDSERVIITLDITNLNDNQIGFILDSVYPAVEKEEGTIGFVIVQDANASIVSNVDVDAVKNITYTAVDSNGTQNESVMQDIAFFPASGNLTRQVTTGLKRYEVESGNWVFKSDVYTDFTTDPNWP